LIYSGILAYDGLKTPEDHKSAVMGNMRVKAYKPTRKMLKFLLANYFY